MDYAIPVKPAVGAGCFICETPLPKRILAVPQNPSGLVEPLVCKAFECQQLMALRLKLPPSLFNARVRFHQNNLRQQKEKEQQQQQWVADLNEREARENACILAAIVSHPKTYGVNQPQAQPQPQASFPGYFGAHKHNHYTDFGYPTDVTFALAFAAYTRHGVARAGVDKTVAKTWQDFPYIQTFARDDGDDTPETTVEKDIRERFATLRDEDAADVPPLTRVLRGRQAKPPARPARWIPAAALFAAAAITAVVLVLQPRGAEPSIEEAIAEAQLISSWTAPTDEWLTLSGLEIPNSVPSLSLSSVTLPEEHGAATPPKGDVQ